MKKRKLFAVASILILLGLQFSVNAASGQAKKSQQVLPFVAENKWQEVEHTGETFYIWTTTITKVA